MAFAVSVTVLPLARRSMAISYSQIVDILRLIGSCQAALAGVYGGPTLKNL